MSKQPSVPAGRSTHHADIARRSACKAMATAALFALSPVARSFAGEPLRIIVPTEPGGQLDVLVRPIANVLASILGRSVIVENKGGAAGQIAARIVAQSRGDSGVILAATMGIMSISPHLYRNLSYDVERDFTPLSLCANVPGAMIVNPVAVPSRTVGEFVDWARRRATQLPYASFGPGSVSNIVTEMFAQRSNLRLTQIPYRSPSQLSTDLLGGEVPLYIDSPGRFLETIKAGQLRALAVTTKQRSKALPEVPTLSESGFPGFDFANWYGFYAPAGIEAKTAERLRLAIDKAVSSSPIVNQFTSLGLDIPASPVNFSAFSHAEFGRWKSFIAEHGIRIDSA